MQQKQLEQLQRQVDLFNRLYVSHSISPEMETGELNHSHSLCKEEKGRNAHPSTTPNEREASSGTIFERVTEREEQ